MNNEPRAAERADDPRRSALENWLGRFDALAGASLAPASGDASFRRYFRVTTATDTFIAMDAPPPNEDCRPFVQIAGYLESMGLNAPRILGADLQQGFMLMTDLGPVMFLDELESKPERADELYADAARALLHLQEQGIAWQQKLPDYDYAFVAFELSIFRDWLCGRHLGIDFDADDERDWQACCELLIDNALAQPRVFMHRDYHSRNLVLSEVQNPGILDFQDAVEGPLTYDVVSLYKDCYIDWPRERVEGWALDYYAMLAPSLRDDLSESRFLRCFELMGAQRHLKAAGIFARLYHRDSKDGYLGDIPRTLAYVSDTAAREPALGFLAELIDNRILPNLPAVD